MHTVFWHPVFQVFVDHALFFEYFPRKTLVPLKTLFLPKGRKEFGEMKESLRRCLSCYLVLAILVMGVVPRVYAGFSPSEMVVLSQYDRSADLEKIQKIMEMKMIRERLEQLGFSQEEIQTRLGQLSDSQIHQLALQLDELRAGGNGEGVIIFLLIVAIIVVLVLWITGSRVVVTK